MKSFAITNLGLEEYAASEITELLGVKTETVDSVVLFDASEEQLALLAYRSQSLVKVCSLLERFKLDEISDLEKIKTDFTKVIPQGKSFRVKSARQGSVDFSSQELDPALADVIAAQFKEAPKVSLNDPDVIVYLYVCNDDAYVGIDYCGFDLGKRDYRVFANPKSVHGNVAYIMLKLAGFTEKKTLLDAFCLSGEEGTEAALYAMHKSPHYFAKNKFAFRKFMDFDFGKADKEITDSKATIIVSSPHQPDVKAAEKNAKIAGVEKAIDFTRQDVEWLDFKVEKGSVDCFVSNIPCPSANMAESTLRKLYDSIFFQIKHALAKNGKAVFLGRNLSFLKQCAQDVKVSKEFQFMNGKETMEVIVFEKI